MLFGGNLIKQPAYSGITYRISGNLENTDFLMKNLFWIGIYPKLEREMLEYIVYSFDIFIHGNTEH